MEIGCNKSYLPWPAAGLAISSSRLSQVTTAQSCLDSVLHHISATSVEVVRVETTIYSLQAVQIISSDPQTQTVRHTAVTVV